MNLKQRRGCFLKGCVTPLIVVVSLYVIWLFWNYRHTYHIQEIDMYVRIEKFPFCDVKMSFSKDNRCWDDYVKYNNPTEIIEMDVYYIPPHTICVSNASCIKQDKFNIIEYEKKQLYRKHVVAPGQWIPDYYDEYSDSTFIKNPSYYFYIYDYFGGFRLDDPNGKTIFNAEI